MHLLLSYYPVNKQQNQRKGVLIYASFMCLSRLILDL